MTNIELWLLNTETIQEAFKQKEKDCKANKCSSEGKQAFCDEFNKIYHRRWRQILGEE